MICEPCAAGADLTRYPPPLPEATRTLAQHDHARCRGPAFCPCQHRVPTTAELLERRAAQPRGGLARVAGMLADIAGECG